MTLTQTRGRSKGESRQNPLTIIVNSRILDLAGFLDLSLLEKKLNVLSQKTMIKSE